MIIVKVPGINGLGRTAGARDAGNAVLEGMDVSKYRHEEIHVDNANLVEQESLIRKNAVKLFEEEDRVIFLGGDHSISFPLVDSFRKVHGGDVKLVVFDAHADCMKPMKEPTHEEWLRALIDSGFNAEDVLIIGLNKVEDVEMKYLKEKEVRMTEDVEEVKEFVSSGKIYVSFDMDVFESVKATGFPEGRMKEEEVMELVEIVNGGDVVGCDIVETHLDREGIDDTLRVAREVLSEFIKK